MAEKEERIYLFTDKLICENCKDWYEHIDPLDSPDCTECAPADFPYITRQDAINRMAKAIKSVPKASGEAVHSTDYAKWAEAALNALLGNK
jgi:hypothetical protein